jgi:polyhydroxyalkanoate synthesis regulator phasin
MNTRILTFTSCFFILTSVFTACNNTAESTQSSETLEEFKAYVDELSAETNANWEEIERKYIQKKNAVSDQLEELSEEEETTFQNLQEEYKILKAKIKEKDGISKEIKESDALEEFKAFVSEVSAESEATWEEIERKYIEKKNNVTDDLDNLSDDAKEEFQELQDKYQKLKEKANRKL